MTIVAPTLQKDGYKEFHVKSWHPDVSESYINFTSRNGRHSNIPDNEEVVFVGFQYFMLDYLVDEWKSFFETSKANAVRNHKRIMEAMLDHTVNVKYLENLHDLGYLPLHIKALEEGTLVPYQVAPVTIRSTLKGFQWLPSMIESVLSNENWPIQTSATTSLAYLKKTYASFERTGAPMELAPYMGHDFSFRGTFGRHAGAMSGFGHLCSGYVGTDTITAVLFAEKYYGANVDIEIVGKTVDATEHGVTCSWIDEGELAFIRHLMKNESKTGILSIVSDTWDFWRLVTEYLPLLKDEIMAREGMLVIRPDSGDPVRVLCGYQDHEVDIDDDGTVWFLEEISGYRTQHVEITEHERKGLVEILWEQFGGTETDKGFKFLDSHIGAIYGDAITLERQDQIIDRLEAKGFVPSCVLGIGSYSFQYVTRDTHGSAVKATNMIKGGEDVAIFKQPKTDPGKNSAKGLLRVDYDEDGKLVMYDNQTREQEKQGLLKTIFLDGKITKLTTLEKIRAKIKSQL